MAAPDVQRALALPGDQVGAALVVLPESQWFDRKSSRVAARELAELLVAFANAEGGVAVIGIANGRVEGIGAIPEGARNAWRQASLDFAAPPLRTRVKELACLNHRGEQDRVMVVEVEPSLVVHATGKDEVLLRVGDESRRLNFQQRLELVYEKGQASFEANAVQETSTDDLDSILVGQYADRLRHPDPARLLRGRGLLTRPGALTAAGVLLFAREPQVHFPVALVRVLRYRGTARGAGAGQQLVRDERCEGPIPRVIERAQRAVTDLIPTRRALAPAGRFEDVPIVPRDAWLEGLVNAVVHRSYGVSGDHIRVEIFDDRVEVESPGRFPGLVDPSQPLAIDRFARNPRIARVCADLEFGQELGEGIRRMFTEMRLAGLVEPSFVQTAGTVRLRLLSETVDRAVADRLSPSARAVLAALREAGASSTGEVMSRTGLARPTVLSALHALQDAGVVEWRGKSSTDPRANWCLAGT